VNNGTITVTPTNGSAPYQYSLDGGAYQSSNIFTGVSAGNHNVVVKDATTCTSANLPVLVTAGAGPSGSATTTATSCSGATNGTITVTPGNGQAPYQFALDGGAYQTSNAFNNVSAGNHNVVVKDAAGCLSPAIFVTVAAGAPLNVNVVATNTSCSGASNGTITLNPTNGSTPYQYSLNGGPGQASNLYNSLAPGNYTINVVDANGCTANNLSATITAGSGLTAVINQTNVTCNGLNNGSMAVNVQAPGTAPFQYSLDNVTFQASNIFNNLAAGSYTVYFKDNINCTGSQTVSITQPAALAMTVNSQAVACFGQSNGVITVNANGGATPYQYSINGTTYQSSNTFNLAAGTYTVYVKDNNGCINTVAGIGITQPTALTLNASTQPASCNGGADGLINVIASGGNSNYQYSIDGITFQASSNFNVIAGNYTVTVKDANNCTATKAATVNLNNNLVFTKGNDTTICEGGSAQLSTSSNAASYSWTPATTLSSSSVANPVATPRTTTQYTVIATLGGCSTSGIITVTVNPAPIPNAGPDADICFGQNAQLNASGGTVYQWTPSTYLSSAISPTPTVTQPPTTMQYSLSVRDANGCSSLVTDNVLVRITPPIKVIVNPRDSIVAEGDKIQLTANSIGTNYSWTNPLTLSNSSIANPVATMPAGSMGIVYNYVVTVSTSAGCKGTASVTLRVYKGPDIYLPTGFTPNGDGKNDKFYPFPVGIKEINYFRIYNRWGQLMFSTTKLNDGWDGYFGGNRQPSGTYVWVAQAVTSNGKVITKQGLVTLIR
jgi:gliding motility-associated-like protein